MTTPIAAASLSILVAFGVATGIAGQQQGAHPQAVESFGLVVSQYESPDKSTVAIVSPLVKPGYGGHESWVELRSKSGKLLTRREYFSADGEHGYCVTKAIWTPDSNFFVYTLQSSGGHQPWHSPVEFYSRRQQKIFSLDDALHDSVTNSGFSVVAPDRVTVELWFSKTTRTVPLSTLVPKK
jgi:hypothetical protein